MSPPAGTSLFMRFFGLAENLPLYAMVGIACGLAAYTPVRHLATAPDVALDRAARGDVCVESARALNRAKHYEGGILGLAASLHNWPTWQQPQEVAAHFHHERWPAPRPFDVPQPTSN